MTVPTAPLNWGAVDKATTLARCPSAKVQEVFVESFGPGNSSSLLGNEDAEDDDFEDAAMFANSCGTWRGDRGSRACSDSSVAEGGCGPAGPLRPAI